MRVRVPFQGRVPTEADKQAEIARLKGQFGRFAARLIDRATASAEPVGAHRKHRYCQSAPPVLRYGHDNDLT